MQNIDTMAEMGIQRPTMARAEAERRIRSLAAQFHVTAGRLRFDYLADTFARLSDAETSIDEVELLLVHLIRRKLVDGPTALAGRGKTGASVLELPGFSG